jgi:hypothetical protein
MKNPVKTLLRQIRNNQFWRKLGFWHYVIIFGAALGFCGLYLYLGARGYFVGGDDALFHISRYFSVLRGWQDGQIVPQTDPTFLSGIGHSWNIFYGPLPAYIVAVVFRLILNWQFAIALVMFAAVLAAGIFAYRFSKEIFAKLKWGSAAALVAAIIYIWSPYLIIDLYGRAAIGEVFAFVFMPLVFHGLWRLANNAKNCLPLLVIGMAGLVLSHSLSVVIAVVFGLVFLLLNLKKLIQVWRLAALCILVAALIVFGLTAFFTLPFIENMSLGIYAINNDWFVENIMYFNAESINNNRLTLENPNLGTRNFSFYLVVILAIAAALFAVFQKPKEKVKTDIRNYLILLGLALILTTTLIDWRLIPSALYTIQFPTRFMGLASLLGAIAAGYGAVWLVQKIKLRGLKIFGIATFLVIVIAAGLTRIPWDVDRNTEADNLSTTTNTGLNEYYTMGFLKDGFSTQLADSDWQYIVHGNAEIGDFESSPNSSTRQFTVNTQSESTIELAQVYYSGFQAIDAAGDQLPTTYSNNGLVKITIPAGFSGTVISKFGNDTITITGLILTILTSLTIVLFYIIKKQTQPNRN